MQHDDEEEKEDLEVDVVLDESLLLLIDVEEQLDELRNCHWKVLMMSWMRYKKKKRSNC